jgi:hypothetical protein
MVNRRWLMMPAVRPTLSAISSVSPLVFTSTAMVADGRGSSPDARETA